MHAVISSMRSGPLLIFCYPVINCLVTKKKVFQEAVGVSLLSSGLVHSEGSYLSFIYLLIDFHFGLAKAT